MLQDLEEFRALKSCVDVVLLQPPRGQFIRGYARIENRRSRARTRNGQQFLGGITRDERDHERTRVTEAVLNLVAPLSPTVCPSCLPVQSLTRKRVLCEKWQHDRLFMIR